MGIKGHLVKYMSLIFSIESRSNQEFEDPESPPEEPEIEYYIFEKIKQKKLKILNRLTSSYFKPIKEKKLIEEVELQKVKQRMTSR
jgi:hypothetical protein